MARRPYHGAFVENGTPGERVEGFSPSVRVQLRVCRTADLAGVVPNADRVLDHRNKCHTVLQ
jgi:hypothetical protein